MYDDNVTYKVGINWKDILIKLIMLILFVFILLLLFPKADLDVFYDTVYSNNIKTMKEAARNYYTIDRLPSNVGDKTSMTLKEMVDDHMLIRFTDKDGKVCDENSSYVEVTKISEKEYTLRVQLKCGDKDDYILETIGCTSVCTNGNCTTVIQDNNQDDYVADSGDDNWEDEDFTKKVTYYQHKKAIKSTKIIYTCPDGYKKSGTKCIKTTTGATIDATPHYNPDQVITTDAKYNEGDSYKIYTDPIKTLVGIDYSCPVGYTLNGTYCIKYTSATEVPGGLSYTCPSGYTLNGTKCSKTYDATYTSGSTSYTCPNGGTLNGTKCTLSTSATSNTTYSCPSGYTQNGNSCYKVYNATSTTAYSCPSGYTKSGTKCTKTTTDTINATPKTTYGSWKAQGTQYYTSAGKAYQNNTSWLQLNGMITGAACGAPCGHKGTWYKYTYYTRSANTTYSCPSGYTLNGTKCTKSSTTTIDATPSTSYSCPNGGTREGSKCTLTASLSKNTTYTCPSGYNRDGKMCYKTYNATPNQGQGSYSCPNGGTLNGTKCTIVKDATPNQNGSTYTCPTGYNYNSSLRKCEKKITATATPTYEYSCPTGYTKTGSGSLTKCYKVVRGQGNYYCEDASAVLNGTKCIKTVKGDISHYTCPTDYVLNGTKCTKKTTVTVDANKETKVTTTYKYKWSRYSKLEGWIFTGKTKVVTEGYSAGQK